MRYLLLLLLVAACGEAPTINLDNPVATQLAATGSPELGDKCYFAGEAHCDGSVALLTCRGASKDELRWETLDDPRCFCLKSANELPRAACP